MRNKVMTARPAARKGDGSRAKKTVAAKSSTYYSDDAGTKVVRKDEPKIPGYGPAGPFFGGYE